MDAVVDFFRRPSNKKYIGEVLFYTAVQVTGILLVHWLIMPQDPARKDAKSKGIKALGKLGLSHLRLTPHERIIAGEIIHSDDISVSFSEIGGLDDIAEDLREAVIYPLCYPELYAESSDLLGAPGGVLLYGPPGCGKTMLAKALAKESGATFINLRISSLTDKYYGESNKLVDAVFSLAKKVEPCIIFIDEIDALFRERRDSDHDATNMIKTGFMTLWDGLATHKNPRIVLLGATNRPHDIDTAILRRMPKRYAVKLPSASQRRAILEILLKDTQLAPDFDMRELVQRTAGCSGSDLKELCRNAAMVPIREYIRSSGQLSKGSKASEDLENLRGSKVELRPLGVQDFYKSQRADPAASSQEADVFLPQENLD
ncbi:P-loop containing nucleoside triphosphate hydrolase protein [Radiomyces spectabilis]|uniref:P-loop containing nucleoside triphosphate hydrolase protein n=1 Tax=Radiomyces spectabilis TaxID=64574 RepID=UPI0022210B78|nr:P-loop containing nucleoside triphosphate hydrolase protein [Radiomyces spectabilis]KAI8371670.1 P-loop containing nucleoside triphosphate hydrolase protein [Radiomyces spectabilis]